MRFLVRMTFWLVVILVLLPSGGSEPTPKINVSAIEAMSAAKSTVTDMRAFCERQPDACAVGSQTAVAIGHRAQAGAKMLYDYLNEHLGPSDTGTVAAPRPARRSRCRRRGPRSTHCRRPIGAGLARPAAPQGRRAATGRPEIFGRDPAPALDSRAMKRQRGLPMACQSAASGGILFRRRRSPADIMATIYWVCPKP